MKCRRCGSYAYHPLHIVAVTQPQLDDSRRMGNGVVLFDGWDNRDVLCRECCKELDRFMQGGDA